MKIKKFFYLIISILLFCTTLLSGCGKKSQYFTAFNSEILVHSYSSEISNATLDSLDSFFTSLDNEISTTNPQSKISVLNNLQDTSSPVEISCNLKELLQLSKEYYTLTNAKFNPAIYPLVKLWQFTDMQDSLSFTLPTQQQIDHTLTQCCLDFNKINISDNNNLISNPQKVCIDLGGIAKGYAAHKAGLTLIESGVTDGYVSLGGSSWYLIKTTQEIFVKHPRKSQDMPYIINLIGQKQNLSLSTSGDYEKYYIHDGKRYSHIIDGTTGAPAQTNILSATVLCKTGALSDALSTAICLYNYNPKDQSNSQLITFLDSLLTLYPQENFEFYVVFNDGIDKQIITNKKVHNHFEVIDQSYSVVDITN